ncbi:MAG: hypothetical protein MUD17_01930 [Gemmatimonadaceae bacterium]|jgi:hypothetical protein|nr:hypothetical protein [Gemmatimonadaceae bacterium]
MRSIRQKTSTTDREPIGIVIADGGAPEAAPRFLAYVWGPVPDDIEQEEPELALVGATA